MSARRLAHKTLCELDENQAYANIYLPSALKRSVLDDRDRALVTELVYGVVRSKLALDWLIGKFAARATAKVEPRVLNLLRLGLYQILYLDRIPDHAAVDTGVELAKTELSPGTDKFVNAILRRAVRERDGLPWPDRGRGLVEFLTIYYSHPRWLVELWLNELGEETTESLLAADNARPKVTLRANTLKVTPADLIEALKREAIETLAGDICPEAVVMAGHNVPDKILKDGLAYVQNEASIAVGHIMRPRPGQTVIDLCAGPGGKCTHLAQLMNNSGRIMAVDVHDGRLKLVKDNCRRLGVEIVELIEGDASKPLPLPEVDHVLVDAPCSGLGVLARRPDSRWRKQPGDIERLAALQSKILDRAADYVKPGGRLTYSVCTITKAETDGVVSRFVTGHRDFRQAPVEVFKLSFKEAPNARFWPHIDGTDGMFIAQFKKTS